MKATCSRTVHFERKVAGVESADVMFLVTTSETSLPGDADAGWTTTITGQQMINTGYVWSCTKVTYTDGSTSYTGKYCIGKCTNFATITEQYVLSASGTTKPPSSAGWKTTYTPVEGMYLWTRNKLSYTNGSATSYTTAICIGYIGKNGVNGTSFTVKGKSDGHYATYAKWKTAKTEMTSDANAMLIDNASDGRGSEYATPSVLTYNGGATDCADISKATVGDAYVVGSELWVANDSAWVSLGTIQGPAGNDGNDGMNAVSVYLSPTSIMHKKSDTDTKYAVICKVKDGNDFVECSSKEEDGKFLVIVKSDTLPDGVSAECSIGEDYYECDFTIGANKEVNADVTFYVVYNKVGYTYTYQIKTIADGEKGDSGTDAVDIQMTTQNIAHKKASTSSTYSVTIKVKVGKNFVKHGTGDGQFYISDFSAPAPPDGVTYTKTTGDTYVTYKITIAKNVVVNTDFSFNVYYDNTPYSRTFSITTVEDGESIKGEKGASLRGPQDWEKLSDGYTFYPGKEGDDYKDVVYYKGNYYVCQMEHAKTSDNYPTSSADTSTGYWLKGDKMELIATDIMLANYAVIKNLGVEAVEMKDSDGNVVFEAKDGNVTCNKGTFENVDVSGTITSTKGSIGSLNIDEKGIGIDGGTSSGSTLFDGSCTYFTNQRMQFYDDYRIYVNGSSDYLRMCWVNNSSNFPHLFIKDWVSQKTGKLGAQISLANGKLRNDGMYINVSGAEEKAAHLSSQLYGNKAILCKEGYYAGFRLQSFMTDSDETLNELDNVVICTNTSEITLTLPSVPKAGQVYIIFQACNGKVNIKSDSNHYIVSKGNPESSSTRTSWYSSTQGQITFIFYGKDGKWYISYSID